MKKVVLTCLTASLLFSCKKDDKKDAETSNLGKNEFKIGNTTYNKGSILSQSGTIILTGVSGTSGGTITVSFNEGAPSSGGTFKIVSLEDQDMADEISIAASTVMGSTVKNYKSETNSSNPSAKVTVDGGKVKVEFSDLTVKSDDGSTEKVSANIAE